MCSQVEKQPGAFDSLSPKVTGQGYCIVYTVKSHTLLHTFTMIHNLVYYTAKGK